MTVRIPRRVRVLIYVCGAGIWLSGGWWLILHFFGSTQGEFGPESNPLQPWALRVHGAFAFASIWLLGLLWGSHVSIAWPRPRRRVSGTALIALIIWLTLSGYLLYYVGDDFSRSALSIAHWGTGLALPVFYALHRLSRQKRCR